MILINRLLLLYSIFFACCNFQPSQYSKIGKLYTFTIKNHHTQDSIMVSFRVDSAFCNRSFSAGCWTNSNKCYNLGVNENCHLNFNYWSLRKGDVIDFKLAYKRDSINSKDAYPGRILAPETYINSSELQGMIVQYYLGNTWHIVYHGKCEKYNAYIMINLTTIANECDIEAILLNIIESIEIKKI